MSQLITSSTTAVTVFIITALLNTFIFFLSEEQRTAMIGPEFEIDGQIYMPVDIANFAPTYLDDVVISMPRTSVPRPLIASAPIIVEELSRLHGPRNEQRLKVSSIEPRQLTRILIPFDRNMRDGNVRIINADARGISVRQPDDLRRTLWDRAIEILVSSLIYATIVGVFMYIFSQYFNQRVQDMRERTDRLTQETERVQNELK